MGRTLYHERHQLLGVPADVEELEAAREVAVLGAAQVLVATQHQVLECAVRCKTHAMSVRLDEPDRERQIRLYVTWRQTRWGAAHLAIPQRRWQC
jgi:hypothetical protein